MNRDGAPAVLVHGSFRGGHATFREQLELGHLVVVDRRGFGNMAAADGWPTDTRDLVTLLRALGSAHLVGHSYGGVVALLAAAEAPQCVRSLVVIEPPVFELARGDPSADATTLAMKPVYDRARELTTDEFVREWARTRGLSEERIDAWLSSFEPEDWAAAEATRSERWPGDAPVQLDVLTIMAFPRVVVSGGYAGYTRGGRDFEAVCRVLADAIGARRVVFEGSTHMPQLEEPEAFNRLLLDVWS